MGNSFKECQEKFNNTKYNTKYDPNYMRDLEIKQADLQVTKPKIFPKAWGQELWINNNNSYCGKILQFKTGGKFSMHFHMSKIETWFVIDGEYTLRFINTVTAETKETPLVAGDVVHIHHGKPHQLICHKEGSIMEVSTTHFETDSYRVAPGDSQNG